MNGRLQKTHALIFKPHTYTKPYQLRPMFCLLCNDYDPLNVIECAAMPNKQCNIELSSLWCSQTFTSCFAYSVMLMQSLLSIGVVFKYTFTSLNNKLIDGLFCHHAGFSLVCFQVGKVDHGQANQMIVDLCVKVKTSANVISDR